MPYSYRLSDETKKYLLSDLLEYKNLEQIGKGTESCVWKGKRDGDEYEVAIKVLFGESDTAKAEEELRQYRPDYLRDKKRVLDMFKADSKVLDLAKRYYKYMIVYDSKSQSDEILKRVLNKEFKLLGYKGPSGDLTIEEVFDIIYDLTGVRYSINNAKDIKFNSPLNTGLLAKFESFGNSNSAYLLNNLKSLFKTVLKICVMTGALADKDLFVHIQRHEQLANQDDILTEIKKIAKHYLKALLSLHDSKRFVNDVHPGNVVVTNLGGKRVKYQLIDFGSSEQLSDDKKLSVEQKQGDMYHVGYSLLIPAFLSLQPKGSGLHKELELVPRESNYQKISEIEKFGRELSSVRIISFADFLKKLRDKKYNSAKEALQHPFLR